MKVLLSLLFLFSFICFGQDHYLVINPEGHRSLIYDMTLDSEGNIITGSFDKTVKVWDSNDGRLIKEFRGFIGPGSEGMVYAVDVSPDDKYLAVGGWMGKDDESEKLGAIRLYDYKTGKLIKRFKGIHEDAIVSLKFTNDSKYLISGAADGLAVRWDISGGFAINIYGGLNLGFSNIAIADDYFITTHSDGMFYKWQYDKDKPKKKMNFFEKLDVLNVASYADVSDDGEWIAVAGKELGMVLIFNQKLSMKDYFFTGDNKVVDLDFSPSGNRLAVAVKEGGKNHIIIYEKQGKEWEELTRYKGHDATALNVEFINENKCASTGGFTDEVAVWKIVGSKTKELVVARGVGETCFSASLNGTELAYGLVADKAYGFASYSNVFNLFSRQVYTDFDSSKFNYPIHEKGEYKLYEKTQARKTDWDPSEILYLTKSKEKVAKIERYPWDGNSHRSYCFAGETYILSGGDYGIFSAYDYEGNIVSRLVGHEGGVSSISISSNEEFIVSAAYDNTIRLWRKNEIGQENAGLEMNSIWDYLRDQYLGDPWYNRITKLGLKKRAKENSLEAWQEVIEKLEGEDYKVDFLKNQMNWEKANVIYPVVSIFVGSNKEWIMWNNEGYFTSSKKGANYVGYHINQGKSKAAKYYPFDQFGLKFNRPDKIFSELGIVSQGIIDLYYKAYLKRLKRMGLTEEELSSEILVPEVKITKVKRSENQVNLFIEAKDDHYPLNRLNVFVNDVPIYGRDGIDLSLSSAKEYQGEIAVELIGGKNKVQISVLNSVGIESLRETIFIHPKTQHKEDLYIVSMGVSNYHDEKYNLEYAAKDAEDIDETLENNQIYENVFKKKLINEEVTKENIYLIKDFLSSAKTGDVVIMFIAGHGVLDINLDYFYCTYDMDFNDPSAKGVSYSELEALFDGIKAIRKLLIMDTCHSGELDKDDIIGIEVVEQEDEELVFRSSNSNIQYQENAELKETNEAIREMFNDLNRGTGTTVISSAGGAQFAMESDEWRNGLFTYCLLNGLKSNVADLNKDGQIFVSELQTFIRYEVVRLSGGKQSPSSRFENVSLDYPIW